MLSERRIGVVYVEHVDEPLVEKLQEPDTSVITLPPESSTYSVNKTPYQLGMAAGRI